MFVVTFARHGETKSNVANIIQGHTHGELTERGISMAEHLGRHLTEEKFTRIYSSDLKRCHDTTLNILKHSKHHGEDQGQDLLVLDELLREMFCGDLELQPGEKLKQLCIESGSNFPYISIPGGESFEDVKKRAAKFFALLCKLADATDRENVLVVTHGGWLMCFLHHLVDNENVDLHEFDEQLCKMRPHNTATTKIVIHKNEGGGNEDGKRKVVVKHVHDITHLPDHLQQ